MALAPVIQETIKPVQPKTPEHAGPVSSATPDNAAEVPAWQAAAANATMQHAAALAGAVSGTEDVGVVLDKPALVAGIARLQREGIKFLPEGIYSHLRAEKSMTPEEVVDQLARGCRLYQNVMVYRPGHWFQGTTTFRALVDLDDLREFIENPSARIVR